MGVNLDLRPLPFARLVSRMLREAERGETVFDLPVRSIWTGAPGKDLSVPFHGMRAATPIGPAAGPHTQMAQNIVLAWLGGGRIMELKTVQILDELVIPRPCIDMPNLGFNVEWSQELKLEQSLEEYVKAAMLIRILSESGAVPVPEDRRDYLFDLSVGYDLKGVRSERVQAFIAGMKDAGKTVDRLRAEIPAQFKRFRDLDFKTELSKSLTLSTFHGCPPDEIEKIVDFLLKENRLHVIVKLNPTLLGPAEVRRLMQGEMGYDEIRTPDAAFEKDAKWEQAAGFIERLAATASGLGLGLGAKFTNTLIVENHREFFPKTEKEMYMSGPPLHVLAMNLVAKFRERFGARLPVSFSAGIDKANFPDAVSAGLVPVTVCSDLLKPGGYARLNGCLAALARRMDDVGASTIPEFVLRARGRAEASGGDAAKAAVLNTADYAAAATKDPRYKKEKNAAVPKKIGSRLWLFDCVTCDKCIPVCPNNANFAYPLPAEEIPIVKAERSGDGWSLRREEPLKLARKHQIANFDDFCNECGNCDVFCPEDGGPYLVKPRFFGTLESWRAFPSRDGFFVSAEGGGRTVHGRFSGEEYEVRVSGGRVEFSGAGFRVRFEEADPEGTLSGEAEGEVDLGRYRIMDRLAKGVLSDEAINYLNA